MGPSAGMATIRACVAETTTLNSRTNGRGWTEQTLVALVDLLAERFRLLVDPNFAGRPDAMVQRESGNRYEAE